MAEEVLQIAEERRQAKSKAERERYAQVNAEFQRIARRDKAFFKKQCKDIEEKSRMEKPRDLCKKTGDIKRTFHARMDMIKDRNCKDLMEAEEIKKRWQESTEELYKKGLNDPGDHAPVITNQEPDILECEVKWTIGSIIRSKASRGDGIPAELVNILKNYAVKMLHSICQQVWKTQQWPQD